MLNSKNKASGWEVYPSVSLRVGEHLKEMAAFESSNPPFIEVDTRRAEEILEELQARDSKPSGVHMIVDTRLPKSKILSEAFGQWNAVPEGTANRGERGEPPTLRVGIVRPGIDLTKPPSLINKIVVHELQHVADYESKSVSRKDKLYCGTLELRTLGKFCLALAKSPRLGLKPAVAAARTWRAEKIATDRPLEIRAYKTDGFASLVDAPLISLSSTKHMESAIFTDRYSEQKANTTKIGCFI